jgi:sulfate adenylyltransferase
MTKTNLILPHGGKLVNLELTVEDKEEITKIKDRTKMITLSSMEQSDLQLIATGAYSPLTGFMNQRDYTRVLQEMRLSEGQVWSLPITLSTSKETAKQLKEGSELSLVDEQERLIGTMILEDKYEWNKEWEAKQIYQTGDEKHPGVKQMKQRKEILLGGKIRRLPHTTSSPFQQYLHDPKVIRKQIQDRGWKTVTAFQTRNPIHRAHEYIQKCALELTDALLLHPLVGLTKHDDIPAEVRLQSYEAILERYYPQERTMLSVFPAAMRYAGPREAVFHAICRQNYGCTHIIIGRDHAGVSDYYGTYEAQYLLQSLSREELSIQPLYFENAFYCRTCGNMATGRTCPHTADHHLLLSGTKVREMLRSGQLPPPEFTRPEVADVLRKAMIQNKS